MKELQILIIVLGLLFSYRSQAQEGNNNNSILKATTMDTSKLTNKTVKDAIDALQANDKATFLSHFTPEAKFSDDGNDRDLKAFFDNAFKHEERFLSIDKVENDGKNLQGDFNAGQWGTFKVYFNFTLNSEGKITRLDIGQVSKL